MIEKQKILHINNRGDGIKDKGFRVNDFELELLDKISKFEGHSNWSETFRAIIREAARTRLIIPRLPIENKEDKNA